MIRMQVMVGRLKVLPARRLHLQVFTAMGTVGEVVVTTTRLGLAIREVEVEVAMERWGKEGGRLGEVFTQVSGETRLELSI